MASADTATVTSALQSILDDDGRTVLVSRKTSFHLEARQSRVTGVRRVLSVAKSWVFTNEAKVDLERWVTAIQDATTSSLVLGSTRRVLEGVDDHSLHFVDKSATKSYWKLFQSAEAPIFKTNSVPLLKALLLGQVHRNLPTDQRFRLHHVSLDPVTWGDRQDRTVRAHIARCIRTLADILGVLWDELFLDALDPFLSLLQAQEDCAAFAPADYVVAQFEYAFMEWSEVIFAYRRSDLTFPQGPVQSAPLLRKIMAQYADTTLWDRTFERFNREKSFLGFPVRSISGQPITTGAGAGPVKRADKNTRTELTAAITAGVTTTESKRPKTEARATKASVGIEPCFAFLAHAAGVAGISGCSRGAQCRHSHELASNVRVKALKSPFWIKKLAEFPQLSGLMSHA
jgi:hypothetical protein